MKINTAKKKNPCGMIAGEINGTQRLCLWLHAALVLFTKKPIAPRMFGGFFRFFCCCFFFYVKFYSLTTGHGVPEMRVAAATGRRPRGRRRLRRQTRRDSLHGSKAEKTKTKTYLRFGFLWKKTRTVVRTVTFPPILSSKLITA